MCFSQMKTLTFNFSVRPFRANPANVKILKWPGAGKGHLAREAGGPEGPEGRLKHGKVIHMDGPPVL